jgi:hypothetical protein
MTRSCGDCTKCCEGYLTGEANGKTFFPGKPCHFVTIGKGCTIYKDRPKDPCVNFKCSWLVDESLPEWFKPSESGIIITVKKINGISYVEVIEAGQTLQANMLSWLIMYALNNNLNLFWTIQGGAHWIGNADFLEAMANKK